MLDSQQPPHARQTAPGIAWQVGGRWQVEGKDSPILSGDAIFPGSLLQPSEEASAHSIMVLLPDGQRVLYECFTVQDCARGFRVPALYRVPEPFGVEMMARIHAALLKQRQQASTGSGARHGSPLPRDEVVAAFGSNEQVKFAGLAANLSDGHYTYDLRSLDRPSPRQFHLSFDKKGPTISLPLPSAGTYALTISDELNTPRIDLFVAAVTPASAVRVKKLFSQAKALIEDWNGDYQGWPLHDFHRAYLESLMQGPKPSATGDNAAPGITSGPRVADNQDKVAEPTFSPKGGLFKGDIAVSLRCVTPDATIRFTVDGSQPIASSPEYHAPINVKGTELTIKAYASAAGKKDSAVVTGIFRIQQNPPGDQ